MKIRNNNEFMKFPLAVQEGGLRVASRAEHIRDQIEQLLFTGQGERVLRPEYGAGVKKMVFEPVNSFLCRITQKRIQASLIELLEGEAAPDSIDVEVTAEAEKLFIHISYTLAAMDLKQAFTLPVRQSETASFSPPGAKVWAFQEDRAAEAEKPSLTLDFFKDSDGNWQGRRRVEHLPQSLPALPDDFDWKQRDWDSFRFAMLSELKQSFPQRTDWSVSDLESVLVEALAFGLDMLSDKADRVMNESFLETACDPDRIKRFIDFLGFNPYNRAPPEVTDAAEYWRKNPYEMNLARRHAPASIVSQERMVTLSDYSLRLGRHPLVKQSLVSLSWDGSAEVVAIALILINGLTLDSELGGEGLSKELQIAIAAFHRELDLNQTRKGVCWMPDLEKGVTPRMLIERYVNRYRMAGQKVALADAEAVGIDLKLTVMIQPNFYLSEVMYEVKRIMGAQPGGFFEPGRLRFGEDVAMGDIMEWVMSVNGVANARVDQLKRSGPWPDRTASGFILLKDNEYAVIQESAAAMGKGNLSLSFLGGIKG